METRTSTLCRCCASEGPSKDLINKYIWMGEEEVYSDMLKECFDISLTMESQNEQGICELCITQLRNAFNFKKQVLFTDKEFRKNLSEEKPFQVEIKQEAPHSESGSEAGAGDVPFNDDDDDDGSGSDYEPLIKKEVEEKPKKRQAKVAAVGRPKRAKTEPATSKSKEQNELESRSRHMMVERAAKYMMNVRNLLLYSNASLIRTKDDAGYACLMCRDYYDTPVELKRHFLEYHSEETELSNLLYKTLENNVKMDITYLSCAFCSLDLKDINDLSTHLVEEHDVTIHFDIVMPIVPLKFDKEGFNCYLCPSSFTCFKMLMEHMNHHFRNYVCDICSAGFVSRISLRSHMRLLHEFRKDNGYACELCKKTYSSKVNLREHVRRAHMKVKRHICHICKEKFVHYFEKNEHVASVHGVSTVLECKACDSVFDSARKLRVHVKQRHLLERNHKCTQCEKCFFTSNMLKDHLVVHDPNKKFYCTHPGCEKKYSRKRILTAHVKRDHCEVSCIDE